MRRFFAVMALALGVGALIPTVAAAAPQGANVRFAGKVVSTKVARGESHMMVTFASRNFDVVVRPNAEIVGAKGVRMSFAELRSGDMVRVRARVAGGSIQAYRVRVLVSAPAPAPAPAPTPDPGPIPPPPPPIFVPGL